MTSHEAYHDPLDGSLPPREARTWAMLGHVAGLLGFVVPIVGSIFGPLLVWLIKRETHPFVDDQGREALNFQINIFLYYFLGGLLVLLLVGFLVLLLIPLYQVVMILVAAIQSQDGKPFRYPLILRFV